MKSLTTGCRVSTVTLSSVSWSKTMLSSLTSARALPSRASEISDASASFSSAESSEQSILSTNARARPRLKTSP